MGATVRGQPLRQRPERLAFQPGPAPVTDRVVVPASASLQNIESGAVLALVRPVPFTNAARVFQKGTGGAAPFFIFGEDDFLGATDFGLELGRATTLLWLYAPNPLPYGEWQWWVASFDAALANADQRLYAAPLGGVLREVASYSKQQVGTGAVRPNNNDLVCGAQPSSNSDPFAGAIAHLRIIRDRQPSLAELQHLTADPAQPAHGTVLDIWPGDDAARHVVLDHSGHRNHGQMLGASLVVPGPPLPVLANERVYVAAGAGGDPGAGRCAPARRRRIAAVLRAVAG